MVGLHWVQSVIKKWWPELSRNEKRLRDSRSEDRWAGHAYINLCDTPTYDKALCYSNINAAQWHFNLSHTWKASEWLLQLYLWMKCNMWAHMIVSSVCLQLESSVFSILIRPTSHTECLCVLQEYRSHETAAEGLVEGRSPHMFVVRIYRRAGEGGGHYSSVYEGFIHDAVALNSRSFKNGSIRCSFLVCN